MYKKRKVLIISTVGLIYDGITNVILSSLKSMDRNGLELYIVDTIDSKPNIRKQFEELGCNVIELPNRRTETFQYFILLIKLIKKNKIDVVHAHGNSGTLAVEMVASWLGGARKRIAHSHNTKCDQKKADKLLRPVFKIFYTDALACGIEAGKWLFGDTKFTVISNGRDINAFSFDEKKRQVYRKKLGINDEIVIGHVGGFYEQKNHVFLIEIYRAIKQIEPKAKLYMIGDGPLKATIESLAKDVEINFTGTIDNVTDYLNAMDGMILPSLFEGLPLVALEWQLNGLPILLSNTITDECSISDNVKFLSLNLSAKKWAEEILPMIKSNERCLNSQKAQKTAREKGFDIKTIAEELRKMYLDME